MFLYHLLANWRFQDPDTADQFRARNTKWQASFCISCEISRFYKSFADADFSEFLELQGQQMFFGTAECALNYDSSSAAQIVSFLYEPCLIHSSLHTLVSVILHCFRAFLLDGSWQEWFVRYCDWFRCLHLNRSVYRWLLEWSSGIWLFQFLSPCFLHNVKKITRLSTYCPLFLADLFQQALSVRVF